MNAGKKAPNNKDFLKQNPWCCLCGGTVAATTIEHAPPKVFFIDKQLPAPDHRVPSCECCNKGSSGRDQVAAYLSLLQATAHFNRSDGIFEYIEKLGQGIYNNDRLISEELHEAPKKLRRVLVPQHGSNRILAPQDGLGEEFILRLFDEIDVSGSKIVDDLTLWAAKQAYALHYLKIDGKILPETSRVAVEFLMNGSPPDLELRQQLSALLPYHGKLCQGKKNSERQYSYTWNQGEKCAVFFLTLYREFEVLLAIFYDPDTAIQHAKGTRIFATNAKDGIFPLYP